MNGILKAIQKYKETTELRMFGKSFKEVPSRDAMFESLKSSKVKWRGSLEFRNVAVYRVDKGSSDNSILAIHLCDDNKFFITK